MEIIIEKLLDGPKLQALPIQTSTTKDQIDKRIPTKISSKKKATAPVIEDADNGTGKYIVIQKMDQKLKVERSRLLVFKIPEVSQCK